MQLSDALTGALIGALVVLLVERIRGSREDRYRYATLKRERYADFVRQAREHARIIRLQMDVRREVIEGRKAEPPPLPDTEDIDALSAEIALIAPRSVWEPSRDVYDALVCLDAYAFDLNKPPLFLHGGPDIEVAGYTAALAAYNASWQEFVKAAKKDLGIRN